MTTKISLPTHYTGQPSGDYRKTGGNYDDVHDAEEADWFSLSSFNIKHWYDGDYEITRSLFTVDLTNFPSTDALTQIYLKCPIAVLESSLNDIYATIVDGRDIYGESGAFGIFKNRTESLGQACIPAGTSFGNYLFRIPFNADGWDLLESYAGGYLTLGVRIDKDIEGIAPSSPWEIQYFYWICTSDASEYKSYIWVEYNATPRHIWVDQQNISLGNSGEKLAYIDLNCAKRSIEGTPTGITGKVSKQIAVNEIYLEYVDLSPSTEVRRIEGTLTGVTGKVPFQIGIDDTKLCYIDNTGAERCSEGTIG